MADNADLSNPIAPRSIAARQPILSASAAGAVPDRALLSAIARGDAQAFRTVMERHLTAMVTAARHITRDGAMAEDIAQEAFLRLWRSAGSIDVGEAGVRPWLRRVVSNLCIDRLRILKREVVSDTLPETAEPAGQLRGLERMEVADRVSAAIAELPDRQRLALTLFHYEGMSHIEIAAALEISTEATESLLARARRYLRNRLQSEWSDMMTDTRD